MDRVEKIKRLKKEKFDLIIIGGGINGAGIARDAALRGLKVALIEKKDFGSGTSETSAKLIHGGFRYLETYQFKIVLESVRERNILLRVAQHIVDPIDFIMPIYENDRVPKWKVLLGLYVYDVFSLFKKPRHKNLNKKKMLKIMPWLKKEGLLGGGKYVDAITDDSRLCLVNVQAAEKDGAIVLNYCKAIHIQTTEKGVTVYAKDMIDKEEITIRGKKVVSAIGIWTEELFEKKDFIPKVLSSRGSHLVFPKKMEKTGITYPYKHRKGGGYIIPWDGITLVGTTDNLYEGDLDEITTPKEDIDFLLNEVKKISEKEKFFSRNQILATFAGARALFLKKNSLEKPVTDISREYAIKEINKNLIVVIGGKLTTYRLLAKKIVDKVVKKLNKNYPRCKTQKTKLPGSEMDDLTEYRKKKERELEKLSVEKTSAQNIVKKFGTRTETIIKIIKENPKLKKRISENNLTIKAEIKYILENEYVEKLDDILIRRLWLNLKKGYGIDCLEYIADQLAQVLMKRYSPEKVERLIEKQIKKYEEYVSNMKKNIEINF